MYYFRWSIFYRTSSCGIRPAEPSVKPQSVSEPAESRAGDFADVKQYSGFHCVSF